MVRGSNGAAVLDTRDSLGIAVHMLGALARDCNGSDSSDNGRRVEIWHLPRTPLDVVPSDLLMMEGYTHIEGHYSIVRDATILVSSLDATSPSSEPREPTI